MEDKVYLKIIIVCLMCAMLPIAIYGKSKFSIPVFESKSLANQKVKILKRENNDKELIAKEIYLDKYIYLAFQSESNFVSYFLDSETGEEKDFLSLLKPEAKDDFDAKIKELLYLKYPKFIADELSKEEVSKSVQILESEIIIHYNDVVIDVEPALEEKLYLRVNYNEIKDYLNITLKTDLEYENENGYHYDKNKKTVAITFDDGPNGNKTNKIVELLEQNKAHATFFMVGNKMNYGKKVIENVLNHGNEIGSHSYAHKNMGRVKINDLIKSEEKTHDIYKSITGKDLIYTRPPYGSINKNIKEKLNTIFINWSLDTEDWLHRDKDYIVSYVTLNVSDGDIILMHDMYDSTVDAVRELLPKLYSMGYQVVSVTELANLKGVTLENHSLYRSLKEV